MFTSREMTCLRSQPLGCIATVGANGQPDNAAVGFQMDDDGVITVGGMDIAGSRKGRNVFAGQSRVALSTMSSRCARSDLVGSAYGRAELSGPRALISGVMRR